MNLSTKEFREGGAVLFACFVGIGVGFSSLNYYTAGIFLTAYESEFGWSRGVISMQGLVGVLALVVLSPIVGGLVDRVGTRVVASTSLFLYALSFLAMSEYLNSITSFLVLSFITAVVAAGSTPVTFTRTVTMWFNSNRGVALGVALVGAGITAFFAPLYLSTIVEQEGWRYGARILSLIVLIGAVTVLILLRDPPTTDDTNSLGSRRSGLRQKEADNKGLSSSVFRQLAAVFFLVAFAVSGLIVHFIPMLVDKGMSLNQAGRYAAVIGVSVILGRVLIGLLIDHFFAPKVASVVFLSAAMSLAIFATFEQNPAILAAIAIGITMGAEVDLISFLTSRYFNLESYGKTYGWLYAVFIVGSAVSPVMMGAMYDNLGTYKSSLILSTGALFVAAAAVLSLPKYPRIKS
ncbi:MAG: MFS transporter [Acidiferrobacterales bacterium]|nr:MFS transporter [Acidiferrobacterales bacterium]